MSNYNSSYANFGQYNNGDISKPWNSHMQPIQAPIISSVKTNVFQNSGHNAPIAAGASGSYTGNEYYTLGTRKSAFNKFYPSTSSSVSRPACGGRVVENYANNQNRYPQCYKY